MGAVTKIGTDAAFALIAPAFLGIAPGFFSNTVEESVKSLEAFMRLCVHKPPLPRDYYFFLGYNAIVPPHVREGLFSRKIENDDLLPRLSTPVLITHGQKDGIVLPATARQHAAAISQAKLSLYPNVAHAPFWEAAPRFNRELRAFAKSVARDGKKR